MADKSKPLDPWFRDGVRFHCVPGCRRCCGGAPGDVWVDDAEIAALATYMKLSVDDFQRSYVRITPSGRKSLRERANYDCILLDEQGCSVYAARPRQCRDYPFWPELLETPFAWLSEMDRCPGLGEGELFSAPTLAGILKAQTKPKH